MAQELVLIPKTKYEYLLSKGDGSLQNTQIPKNIERELQQNGENIQKNTKQNGGQITETSKKKFFVKQPIVHIRKDNEKHNKKTIKKAITQMTNITANLNRIKKEKNVKKRKWISYDV